MLDFYCVLALVKNNFFSPGDELVYLDPHTTQPVVDLDEVGSRDDSYHCPHSSRMKVQQLDPSVALVSVDLLFFPFLTSKNFFCVHSCYTFAAFFFIVFRDFSV